MRPPAWPFSCEEGLEVAARRCTPEFPWGAKAAGATGGATLQVPSALHRAQAVEAELACLLAMIAGHENRDCFCFSLILAPFFFSGAGGGAGGEGAGVGAFTYIYIDSMIGVGFGPTHHTIWTPVPGG